MGYVGLPLAVEFAEAGQHVMCVDTNVGRITSLRARRVLHRGRAERAAARGARPPRAHDPRLGRSPSCDAIVVCVPTPLTPNREPDLGPLMSAAAALSQVAAARTARGPRVHDLPRARRASGCCRCSRSPACGRASTSTSPSRPSASTRAARTTRCATRPRSSAGSRERCGERAAELYAHVCDELVPRLLPGDARR